MIGGKIRYFSLLVILFLNLFMIIKMGLRVNYLGELMIFILFFIASLIILVSDYKEKSHGFFTSVFFMISLLNLFYIKNAFAISPAINVGIKGFLLFGLTLLLNAIGFLIGTLSIEKCCMSKKEKEDIIETIIEPKIRAMQEKLDAVERKRTA